MTAEGKLRQGAMLVAGTGVAIVGYGLTFLYTTYAGSEFELGVAALDGASRAELAASNPEVLHYMDHLHFGLGGLLVALGGGLVALGWYGVRSGQPWSIRTSLGVALIALATNVLVHFEPGFGYDWVIHLLPSLLVTLLVLLGVGRAYQGVRTMPAAR
jgi:hypothetical protein